MTITITTTAAEDAAILALTKETPDVFVNRHVRHQLDFALVKTATPTVAAKYAAAPRAVQVQVDTLLAPIVVS